MAQNNSYSRVSGLRSDVDRATGGNKSYSATGEIDNLTAQLNELGVDTSNMQSPVQSQPYSFTQPGSLGGNPYAGNQNSIWGNNTFTGTRDGSGASSMWDKLGDGASSLFGKDNLFGAGLDSIATGYGLYRNWDLHDGKKKNLQLGNDALRQQIGLLAQNKDFAQQDQKYITDRREANKVFTG